MPKDIWHYTHQNFSPYFSISFFICMDCQFESLSLPIFQNPFPWAINLNLKGIIKLNNKLDHKTANKLYAQRYIALYSPKPHSLSSPVTHFREPFLLIIFSSSCQFEPERRNFFLIR